MEILSNKEQELFNRINNELKTSIISKKPGTGTVHMLNEIAEKMNMNFLNIVTSNIENKNSKIFTDILKVIKNKDVFILFDDFNKASVDIQDEVLNLLVNNRLITNNDIFIIILC